MATFPEGTYLKTADDSGENLNSFSHRGMCYIVIDGKAIHYVEYNSGEVDMTKWEVTTEKEIIEVFGYNPFTGDYPPTQEEIVQAKILTDIDYVVCLADLGLL